MVGSISGRTSASSPVARMSSIPREGVGDKSSLCSSSRMRSAETLRNESKVRGIAAWVSGSRANPSWAAWRRARMGRRPSSVKRRMGSPTARTILRAMSPWPSKGSMSAPAMKGRHLDVTLFLAGQDRHRAMLKSGGNRVARAEDTHGGLGQRAGRDVEIARGAADEQVAHAAADDECRVSGFPKSRADAEDVKRNGPGVDHEGALRPLHDGQGALGGVLLRFLLRSEEHTSELQSPCNLVCRLL